jgi:hypothetical protein
MDDFNFIFLGKFDISSFKKKILNLTEEDWNEYTFRQKVFREHAQTKTVPLLFNEQFTDFPDKFKFYSLFEEEVQQLEKFLFDYYKKGKIIRCIITKLLAHQQIPRHADGGSSLREGHRHHIPIVTNSKNQFEVNGEVKYLKPGEVWEINNSIFHSVANNSSKDRIHIIVDWNTKY